MLIRANHYLTELQVKRLNKLSKKSNFSKSKLMRIAIDNFFGDLIPGSQLIPDCLIPESQPISDYLSEPQTKTEPEPQSKPEPEPKPEPKPKASKIKRIWSKFALKK